jgi:hypothetical protein
MELGTLHAELKRREIILEMDDSKLIAVDPYDRLSPALDEAIREHRNRLVSELQSVSVAMRPLREAVDAALVTTDLDQVIDNTEAAYQRGEITEAEVGEVAQAAIALAHRLPATIENMPLSDFAKSNLFREVKSKTLGETVLWAADNADVGARTDLVVYRASELMALVSVAPEHLRCIHRVKKHLDGEAIDL